MEDSDNKRLMKNAVFIILILMLGLFVVSLVIRHKTGKITNDVDDKTSMRTEIIYNDIKLLSYGDLFSHDVILRDTVDSPLYKYLSVALRKGDTVVHVSNGIGTQALLIAKLIGQSGRVYVYNPYEKYVSAIKRSAELNNFEHRLHTYVYAIADHIFDGWLVYRNNFPVMSGEIQPADYRVPAGYSYMPVKVSTIDAMLPEVQRVNMLVMFGNNVCNQALMGAIHLIERSPDITILLSANRDEQSKRTLREIMMKFSFHLSYIKEDGLLHKCNGVDDIPEDAQYIILGKQ